MKRFRPDPLDSFDIRGESPSTIWTGRSARSLVGIVLKFPIGLECLGDLGVMGCSIEDTDEAELEDERESLDGLRLGAVSTVSLFS